MKVSAISKVSADDYNQRKNVFIRYTNSFMSMPSGVSPANKAFEANKSKETVKILIKI